MGIEDISPYEGPNLDRRNAEEQDPERFMRMLGRSGAQLPSTENPVLPPLPPERTAGGTSEWPDEDYEVESSDSREDSSE